MVYIMGIISFGIIIYNYNKLIKNEINIKSFLVMSCMIIIGILYSIFLDNLKEYSMLKLLKKFSNLTMPWFIEFMKT